MNRKTLILSLDFAAIGCAGTYAMVTGASPWIGVVAGILFIAAVILTIRA